MALVVNTITRYDAFRAVREDLSGIIYNISPVDVPMMSNSGRDTAKQTTFEWQTDQLAAPANNPVLEGDDVTGVTDPRAPVNRVNNFTQINRKIVEVTGTLEATDKAGMKSYLAYELSKASMEMKRDMETAVTGKQAGAQGNNTTPRHTAGIGCWIVTNWNGGAGGAAPVMSSQPGGAGLNPIPPGGALDGYPTTPPTAGTARGFTEAMFKSAMQSVWTQGGDPKSAFVNATQKIAMSAFAGIATRFRDVPAGKQAQIIGAADLYVGDFGTAAIVADRFMPMDTCYVGDPEYLSLSYLRNFQTLVLAKTADAEKRMLICEWGLRVRAQKAWASVMDLQ